MQWDSVGFKFKMQNLQALQKNQTLSLLAN